MQLLSLALTLPLAAGLVAAIPSDPAACPTLPGYNQTRTYTGPVNLATCQKPKVRPGRLAAYLYEQGLTALFPPTAPRIPARWLPSWHALRQPDRPAGTIRPHQRRRRSHVSLLSLTHLRTNVIEASRRRHQSLTHVRCPLLTCADRFARPNCLALSILQAGRRLPGCDFGRKRSIS